MSKELIYSPLVGSLMDLKDSPDKVFSGGMLGQGVAIDPSNGKIHAPVDGVVAMVFPTKHAIGLKSEQGNDILIHFGIDTVKLNGEGFKLKVKEGQKIKQGDLLLSVNLKKVSKKVPSIVTPITVTNSDSVIVKIVKNEGDVTLSDHILTIESK